MMSEDGIPVPSTVGGFVQELNSNPNPNPNSIPLKRKRSLPGTPDPDAEVIALSPKSLMATNRFLCEICNKGFQRDQNLQLHRRGHNLPWKLKQRTNKEVRKKVYVCPEKSCVHHDPSRALGDLTGIKKHFSRKHGEKKWKCEKCSKKYAVQSDWKAHSKICGTREYKCDCGTLFSRKDSFITHRAFCDALAEENARFTSVSAVNQNFKHDLINGTISNPQLAGIPQLPSAFHPEFAGSESVSNLIADGQKPKLPLWLDNAAQLRQIGITNNSNAYLASLPELVPNASMSNMFGSTSQMQWLNKYPEASFTSADLTIASLPRVLKEEQENKGNLSESGVTLYPNNNQNQQTGPGHMSATALLQKAAQIGKKTMLDLNVDILSNNSVCDEKDTVMELVKLPEDSGTSTSSIVNAEEPPTNAGDEDSSNNSSSEFMFDILKRKEKYSVHNTDEVKQKTPSSELVTRTLFPITGVRESRESEFILGSSSSSLSSTKTQWLNLSFANSGRGQPELRIMQQKQQQARKSRRGPRSRSSQYRGVTFYRRTGRWESHIWDCGKQVYLGGFDTAHAAARAYDRAAIKFRGIDADINFSVSDYGDDMKQTRNMTKEEFIHTLRRQSTGFARGNSKYRGVTLHKCGRWEARMGQFLGKKAYDMAAIKSNGREAVTNFEPCTYEGEIIVDGNTQGNGHNLDLSLGISNGSKGKDNVGDCLSCCNRERLTVHNSASAPLGGQPVHSLTMASKHLPVWSGICPGYLQGHEGMATGKTVEAVSSQQLSSWGWQIEGNGIVAPVPLFSIAASSGFSSSTTTAPSATFPSNPQNNCVQNPLLPLPTTSTSNTNISNYFTYRRS